MLDWTSFHDLTAILSGTDLSRLKDKFVGGYKQLWKCKDGKYRNYNKTSYDRQPWETQAYDLEGKLSELYEIMKEKG